MQILQGLIILMVSQKERILDILYIIMFLVLILEEKYLEQKFNLMPV